MKKIEEEKLFTVAEELYGRRAQLEMAQEEATELALAIRKYIRNQSIDRYLKIGEEIADMEIMIDQLKFMFQTLPGIVKNQRTKKMERLQRLLGLPSLPHRSFCSRGQF